MLSKMDHKVDRAFDRVDGLVGRLSRPLGAHLTLRSRDGSNFTQVPTEE